MISLSKSPFRDRFDKKKNNRFDTLWFRPSAGQLCEFITMQTWSPITWKHGTRYKTDVFQWCAYLALDFDEGYTLEECKTWIKAHDYQAIIGASKSHQIEKVLPKRTLPACDRFRVVIPFERTIRDPELYEYNMRYVMENIRPETDEKCKDTKRLFFPCKSILWVSSGLNRFPVQDFPGDYTSKKTIVSRSVEANAKYAANKTISGKVLAWLRHGAPRGKGNDCCFAAGRLMTLQGFSEDEIMGHVARSKLAQATDYERGVLQGIEYGRKALAGQ